MPSSLTNPLIDEIRRVREKKVQEALQKQIVVTIIAVFLVLAINVGLDYIGLLLPEKFRTFFRISTTLLSLLVSIPVVKISWGKKQREIDIPAKYDFRGKWIMGCEFEVPAINEKSIPVSTVEFLKSAFNKRREIGLTTWEQDELSVKVICEKAVDIWPKGKSNPAKNVVISFASDEVSFDSQTIRWAFSADIDWGVLGLDLNSEFRGVEEYSIVCDKTTERPQFLKGCLLGCVQKDGYQFILRGRSWFSKVGDDYEFPDDVSQIEELKYFTQTKKSSFIPEKK